MSLAFPTSAVYQGYRTEAVANGQDEFYASTSENGYGTPMETDDFAIDPAILGEQESMKPPPRPPSPPSSFQPQQSQSYFSDPLGDPFAAPLPPEFPTNDVTDDIKPRHLPSTPKKPAKKKRKPDARRNGPPREEECSFCQGNDSRNKRGVSEPMVSCINCGRSGHPTCLQIDKIANTVRSYAWKCIECKACEICEEKGDDTRLLFCDTCDRGWHTYCLNPPLIKLPRGSWKCPKCRTSVHLPQELQPQIASSSRSRAKAKAPELSRSVSADVGEAATSASATPRPNGKSRGARLPDLITPAPKRPPRLRVATPIETPPPARVVLRLPSRKGKEKAVEEESPRKNPFEDLLPTEDADVTRTAIVAEDKLRFERSRLTAEMKHAPPAETPASPGPMGTLDTPIRPLRSLSSLAHIQIPPPTPASVISSPGPSTPGPPTLTGLRVRTIRFGQYDIDTWYDAPFPEEYANIPEGRMYMCEYCLKYMKSSFIASRHQLKCPERHPPGDEIYRDGAISVFEVDGRKNKIYCQNLCLLSKMFLDHKSLFYDVEPFLFYVMTEVDDMGARFVGYFSKEKRSPKDYNVSCIMTLPVRQRQGWGYLLIDFSYLLSKKEGRVGTPERPLSALGELSYRKYWTLEVMRYLHQTEGQVTLESISIHTSMTLSDIYDTLREHDLITVPEVQSPPTRTVGIAKYRNRKSTSIARRNLARKTTKDDVTATTTLPTKYLIRWDSERVEAYLRDWEAKGYLRLKPERLKWSPFLLSRARKSEIIPLHGLENGAVMSAGSDQGNTPMSGSQGQTGDLDVIMEAAAATTPRRSRRRNARHTNGAEIPRLSPELGAEPNHDFISDPSLPSTISRTVPPRTNRRTRSSLLVEEEVLPLAMTVDASETRRRLRKQHPSAPDPKDAALPENNPPIANVNPMLDGPELTPRKRKTRPPRYLKELQTVSNISIPEPMPETPVAPTPTSQRAVKKKRRLLSSPSSSRSSPNAVPPVTNHTTDPTDQATDHKPKVNGRDTSASLSFDGEGDPQAGTIIPSSELSSPLRTPDDDTMEVDQLESLPKELDQVDETFKTPNQEFAEVNMSLEQSTNQEDYGDEDAEGEVEVDIEEDVDAEGEIDPDA